MITISNVIKQLEEAKQKHGDILVRTVCQVAPHTVDFSFEISKFFNEDKSINLDVLLIKGYKDRE